MRLVSPDSEKALLGKVRNAYAKMTKAAVDADLFHVVYAVGYAVGADPFSDKEPPTMAEARRLAKTGLVHVDREAVDHAKQFLKDSARTIRDRLVGKVRAAISHASASYRKAKVVGKQKMNEARDAGLLRVHAAVQQALQESQRDWGLAVDYAVHDLLQEAKAAALVKQQGADPLVYMQSRPDCCDFCRLFYTTDGKTPRIFNLSELVANGTNVGRKAGRPTHVGPNATEWKPVLGPTHVRCRCQLRHFPLGAGFDANGVIQKEVGFGRRTG